MHGSVLPSYLKETQRETRERRKRLGLGQPTKQLKVATPPPIESVEPPPPPPVIIPRAKSEYARPPHDLIIRTVAAYFRLIPEDIKGNCREAKVTWPRFLAELMCKRHSAHRALNEIGRSFGKRDHTSILNGVRKAEILIAQDPQKAKDREAIENLLIQGGWAINGISMQIEGWIGA